MSFQQGLSGLNASAKALDVVSNNIANANTVGFKSAATHFADVFANSLSGGGAAQAGIGVTTAAIAQQFSQGNITSTNNPLDLSINGGGFYRMSNNGTITYTRNGQFHLDKSGNVIDDRGRQLTGYGVQDGIIVQAAPAPLQLSSANIDPRATGATNGGGVKASVNFDARSVVPPNSTFSRDDPRSYNWSTSTTVFDSLGNEHILALYAVSNPPVPPTVPPTGVWEIYATLDNTSPTNTGVNGGVAATLTFNDSGVLQAPRTIPVTLNLNQVITDLNLIQSGQGKPLYPDNAATNNQTFNIDFTGSTQYGAAFGTNSMEQDGYTSGRLTGVSVSADGIVRGNYSNGQSTDMGQVVLANFTNPNGLTSLGGNQWAETSTSGAAQVGAPNTGTLGVLQSAAVEESNTDLTAELVNMITQQRNYQANAQSIKTQDSIMQTLVNLR